MSRTVKSMTAAQIEDLTLGAFQYVPTSQTVDHLVRYLSTWSGSDKLFMILQYTIKLLVPFLHFRARIQHATGFRTLPVSLSAARLKKLDGIIGDARMLWRIWGILPIIQWLTSLERNPPPTRTLVTIERLQGWAMLAYYPLEHLYYLISHSILPPELPLLSLSLLWPVSGSKTKSRRLSLNPGVLGMWSCRFWAIYVLLQFAHLREDMTLLRSRERAVAKTKTPAAVAEKEELKKRWDALWSEVIVNLGYLPLTLHWSLEKGLFKNDVWVGVFGLIAAVASWRSGWKATALPVSPASAPLPPSADINIQEKALDRAVTDEDILQPLEINGYDT